MNTVVDVVPVDVSEERVIFDALGAATDVAQPPGTIDGAEGADDILSLV